MKKFAGLHRCRSHWDLALPSVSRAPTHVTAEFMASDSTSHIDVPMSAAEPCATCSVLLSLRCGLELQALEAAKSQNQAPGKVAERTEPVWEVVMEKKDFKVWRRPIPDSHLYEYRGGPVQSHLGAACVWGTLTHAAPWLFTGDSLNFSCFVLQCWAPMMMSPQDSSSMYR